MRYFPDLNKFSKIYDSGRPQLVWTQFVSDLETPVSASLKLISDGQLGFLLESVLGGESRGRYSVIGIEPDILWKYEAGQAQICTDCSDTARHTFTPCEEPPLESLRKLMRESQVDFPEELPPMAAGLVGYLGYETISLMEKVPVTNPDTLGIPDGYWMRPGVMVIFDGVASVTYLVTTVRPAPDFQADFAYESALLRLRRVMEKLEAPTPRALRHKTEGKETPLKFTSNVTRDAYHNMVHKAKEYIRAGDIFQVVPSQRLTADFPYTSLAFYRSLRHLNPSPFLFHLNFGTFQIVGSSPEILVRLRDGTVTIRPIAGTRKRGRNRAEDEALATELLADPKEIAEHLMLLDLGRNDVGRVAQPGTVKVTEEMVIERYSHVMHIVSNVEGKIDPKHDALDALMAGFPAGTVTGAPKIRAMQIINELENMQRKFYAGCVGYFAGNGSMDSCIALRTALIRNGKIHLQAGGGVVVDSDPEAEYQESDNKAQALMRAAEKAALF